MIEFDVRNIAHLKSNLINWDKININLKQRLRINFYIENDIDSTIKDNISGKIEGH